MPAFPQEYICRLVYNRRHRSVALVKKSGAVVGGITYRAFRTLKLGEIAFCAITSAEQVRLVATAVLLLPPLLLVATAHLLLLLLLLAAACPEP